ncbi:MAG: Rho termination factor N-terminal domain-containing protein, partial [Nocardioides sp.]
MTETIDSASTDAADSGSSETPKKRSGGLNSMLLADLKAMAAGLGVRGTGSMKKAQLVDAIKAAQSGGHAGRESSDEARPAQQEHREPQQHHD